MARGYKLSMESVSARAHAYARQRGVSPRLYACARTVTIVVLRIWFRVRILGREHIPAEGPGIIAPNHKNFLDAFFVGIATRRHVRYMAKTELFRGPLGGLFLRLGAFPVRRGEGDADAVQTARALLKDGGLVVLFPEGTRVEAPDALGAPHHGAGRLARETGAQIIPAAITGTSHLWRGAVPHVKRVQLTFLPPVMPERGDSPAEQSELIDDRVWPAVRQEYGRLRAAPGIIAAVVAALGFGGGLLARHQRERGRLPRLLGQVEPRRLRRRRSPPSVVAAPPPRAVRRRGMPGRSFRIARIAGIPVGVSPCG